MLFVFGCATSPDKISPSYVSPLQYQSYSCSQIEQEFARIGRRVSEVTGQQQRERTKDQWAFGIGMVLFWPALFFMIGSDKKEELSNLKGQYEALQGIAIRKDCANKSETKGTTDKGVATENGTQGNQGEQTSDTAVGAKLLKLKELYEKGLIEQEEYDRKRNEILDQL